MDFDYEKHRDAFNKVTSASDMWLKLAGIASAEEMEKFLDGLMSCYVIMSYEFERRYPKEAAAYNKKQDEENSGTGTD